MSTLRRRKTWNQEKFTDDANEVWWVHKREICAGSHCALHNPSDHPLKDAPLVLRHASPFSFKPHGFAERFCEHGIGHSDPDSVAFYSQQGDDSTGIHGCDGCCSGSYEMLNPPRDNKGWGTHEHHFEYFDDENGHSGSFCECGEPDPTY